MFATRMDDANRLAMIPGAIMLFMFWGSVFVVVVAFAALVLPKLFRRKKDVPTDN